MTIYDTIKNLEKMLLRLLLGMRLLIYSKKRTTGAVTNKGRLLLKVRALIQTLRYLYTNIAYTGCPTWNHTKVKHWCDHVFRARNLSFWIFHMIMRTFIFFEKYSEKVDVDILVLFF